MKQAEDLLDVLKLTKSSISKASPIAAFQQIEDQFKKTLEAEKKARADTVDEGSLVEQSQDIRAEVAENVEDKLQEVNDNLQQTKSELDDVKDQVDMIALS